MDEKKKYRYLFLGVAGCILLYWALTQTSQLLGYAKAILKVLSPFIVGAVLAFVLNVPMRALERPLKGIKNPRLRRAVALLLTFLAVSLVITGVILLLVPQITKTFTSLMDSLPDFYERAKVEVLAFLNARPELMTWLNDNTSFNEIDWSQKFQEVMAMMNISVSSIVNIAKDAVVGVSTGIFNAVLSLVFCIYGLARKEILARQARRLLYASIPEKIADEVVRIMRMTNSTFSNFISGQCLEALILASMFAVCMLIFRMPYVALISVIIAVTALVPIVGALVGCVIGAFFILVVSPVQAFWFVVMFLILQQIENNLIYPRVVGSSIGLPGMWVLVAVAVGGDMMGITGMLLMIPLASVLYSLLREFTERQLPAKGIDPDKLRDHPPILKSGFQQKREKKEELKKKREEKAKQQEVPPQEENQ